MLVPVSWLREFAALPAHLPLNELDAALVAAGLEVEQVTDLRDNVSGPLKVGVVVSIEELTEFKKPIRACRVDVGEPEPREIVCGAMNFSEGDLVVVALPGAVLSGGFAIGSRKTYGRLSDGMICSARELGAGDDHFGIIVLPPQTEAAPGDDARPVVGLDDVVFELAVTPDMGYCFSVRGIAREAAHRLGVEYRDPAELAESPSATPQSPYPVTVDPATGCDRFALRAVRGVDPSAESPEWLRQRLVKSGMRPISLAVDVTNYLMLELGQPLHAFDLSALQGTLTVRSARAGETLTTLDDVKRTLDPEDVVIADDTGVLSLAGVMGGQTSEVSDSTVDVLLEGAHWSPVAIARTSRRHRLSSEAAKRFERGVDPQLCAVAVQRAAELLTTYGGGVIDERVGDVDTRTAAQPMLFDSRLPNRIVGVDYDPVRVRAALTSAGCEVAQAAEGKLQVTPPSWRPDITDAADLVEEVVRLDGYDQVPSRLPQAPAGNGLTVRQRRRRHVGRSMAGAGYVETLNYPFTDPKVFDDLGLDPDDPRRHVVGVANPIVDNESALRTTLLPALLRALKTNVDRGNRDVALFELGLVFLPREGEQAAPPSLPVRQRPSDEQLQAAAQQLPDQPQHLAVALTGKLELDDWRGAGRTADWSDAVAAGMLAARSAGAEVTVRQAQHAPWHPGRCGELLCDGQVVGAAGELHPEVCDALEVPRRTCAMELNIDALPFAGVTPAPAMSRYPAAIIDVAVLVDASTPAADVHDALADGAGELLEDIRLFDVYSGGQLGEGKKSLAYKLRFRAPDRTLTDAETVAARENAVAAAARRCGASLRLV